MLITSYPDIVRREGINVEVVSGFSTRSNGAFRRNPPAIVWHHDASPPGPSPGVLDWMISNWNNASANVWVDYSGKWWFVGAGVAWHAGAVLPGMPGNFDAIGIETDYTVGETISPRLYDSLRRGTAAIMRANNQPVTDLHFHKTICSPVGRKSDPWGLDLITERAAVGRLMAGTIPPLPKPDTSAPPGPGGADPNPEDDMYRVLRNNKGWDYAVSNVDAFMIRDPDHYQFLLASGAINVPHGRAPVVDQNLIDFCFAEADAASKRLDERLERARLERVRQAA